MRRPRAWITVTQGQLHDELTQSTSPISATEAVSRYGLITQNQGTDQRDIRHQDGFLQVTVQLAPPTTTSSTSTALPSSATFEDQFVQPTRTDQAYERSTGDRVASISLWGTLPTGPGVAMYVNNLINGARAADVH